MLPDPLDEVRGDADVQRPVAAAGEDVDGRLLCVHPSIQPEALDSRLRGNDEAKKVILAEARIQ